MLLAVLCGQAPEIHAARDAGAAQASQSPTFRSGVTLLTLDVTRQHLDDPNIGLTDSCAVPDHPVMSRLWTERKPIGTLVVGLTPVISL